MTATSRVLEGAEAGALRRAFTRGWLGRRGRGGAASIVAGVIRPATEFAKGLAWPCVPSILDVLPAPRSVLGTPKGSVADDARRGVDYLEDRDEVALLHADEGDRMRRSTRGSRA